MERSGTTNTLSATPLSAEAFQPFGCVVGRDAGDGTVANDGWARRYDRVAEIENLRSGAAPNLAVFSVQPQTLPLIVDRLEVHRHSSQTFVPMGATDFLVAVCLPGADGAPEVASLRAFIGRGVGITYRAGIWHHPIVTLARPQDFAMLVWEDGTDGDCEYASLSAAVTVTG